MNLSLLALFLSVVCATILSGFAILPLLNKLKISQTVREDGPESHKLKNGTPTMGGFIFIISITVTSLLVFGFDLKPLYPLITLLCFAGIGFVDDMLKILRRSNLGFCTHEKLIWILLLSIVLSFTARNLFGTIILIPFTQYSFELGNLYVPLLTVGFIGASNAVNITDGVDGLATSVTFVVLGFIIAIASIMGLTNTIFFSIIAAGGMLGFLIFNKYPAEVFMGDTGSLAIGGMLMAIMASIQNPLLLILLGGVYVIETLSVILQVSIFKISGKRFFKMSPLHHHLELCGMTENKIVKIFIFMTICFGVFAIVAI